MNKMMFAIKKNSFEGNREVTCYSCHRGSLKPDSVPFVESEVQTKPQMMAASAEERLPVNMPAADELIDKYIRALGGKAAIEKITSREEHGTITLDGQAV